MAATLSSACGGQADPARLAHTDRPVAYVMDQADIIPADREAAIASRLKRFEKETKHQMVVVTTPSLNGETIEAYSLALANGIGVGRETHHDGLMLLIAPKERKLRIEVGLGLETALTNPEAATIIARDIRPSLVRGDMPDAIARGIEAMAAEAP